MSTTALTSRRSADTMDVFLCTDSIANTTVFALLVLVLTILLENCHQYLQYIWPAVSLLSTGNAFYGHPME